MAFAFLLLLAATSAMARSPALAPGAHATLVSSEPAANSRLTASPSRIRLVFSEPVEGHLARVTLVPASGQPRRLSADADPRDVNAVIAIIDSISPGGYRVNWRVVSADGHPVDGTFTFTLADSALGTTGGPPVPEPPAVEPDPGPQATMEDDTWGPSLYGAPLIPAVFRGAGLGALMALAGLLFFRVRAGRAIEAGDTRVSRVLMTAAVAAPLLLTAHVVTWLINTSPDHTLDRAWMSAALGTSVGRIELWRAGLALLALWAWWIARRIWIAIVFSAAALAVSGAAGHSAAIEPLLSVPVKSIHLLASAMWVGGLLCLVVRPAADTLRAFVDDAERVSSAALVAVIAIALSGVIQTLTFLPSVADVFTSPYGWLALAKTAGLLVLVGFGAYHRQRVMPGVSGAHAAPHTVVLRSSVRRELIIMSIVILLVGLLAYVPPPGEGDRSTPASEPTS
jgi:copper transport protein